MALSGVNRTTFTNNGGFELILEWSAKQDIAGNSSTVTAILKIRGIYYWSSVYDATASATHITINGNTKTFNATSTVSGGQTKELGRHTVKVPHGADGKKTFSLSGDHYWDISWNGGGYLTPKVSGSHTLNPIARASTGKGSNFVFNNNSTITINRASSSFKHKARFHVDGLFIKEITGLTTTGTFNFTDAERKKMLEKMNKRVGVPCRVDLTTLNGSTQVGSVYKFSYNVNAPARASSNATGFAVKSEEMKVTMTAVNTGAKFNYDVEFSLKGKTYKRTKQKGSFTFKFTDAEMKDIISSMGSSVKDNGKLKTISYYDGVAFGDPMTSGNIPVTMDGETFAPKVSTGSTFKDSNQNTVGITKNDQLIIQNASIVSVTVPDNLATAVGGATLKTIRLSIGGTTKDFPYSDKGQEYVIGKTNADKNTNITVSVIDSRGFIGTDTLPADVLPYKKPEGSIDVERDNHYESATTINIWGTYYPLVIDGKDLNTITRVLYRAREAKTNDWGSETLLEFTANKGNLASEENRTFLDNTKSWEIEVDIIDKLGEKATIKDTVDKGVPLMFLDSNLKSLGVGLFPEHTDTIEVNKTILGDTCKLIPSGTDLNNIKTAGKYMTLDSATTKTLKNLPNFIKESIVAPFTMTVTVGPGISQKIVTHELSNWGEFERIAVGNTWGAWFLTGGQTPWTSITLASNFKNYYGDMRIPEVKRIGANIYMKGAIAPTKDFDTGINALHVATLPKTFIPRVAQKGIGQGSSTWTFSIDAGNDGKISISRYQGGVIKSNAFLNFDFSFSVT